jgi:hypothetical protein
MTQIKKVLRIAGLVFLIVLASMGIGLVGTFLPNREKYMDNEIRTEQADKKNEEDGEESQNKS